MVHRDQGVFTCWPPVGWVEFAKIPSHPHQALAKDLDKARIYGLQYKIVSVPLFKMETNLFRHDISIEGWHYSILNDSSEYPVLSFSLYDRFDPMMAKESFIGDIRSFGGHIPQTRKSAQRVISAGLFFIRQILNGSVPDTVRVLKAYKLHPLQASLYHREMGLMPPLKDVFAAQFSKQAGL
jgi:hypothetical protein